MDQCAGILIGQRIMHSRERWQPILRSSHSTLSLNSCHFWSRDFSFPRIRHYTGLFIREFDNDLILLVLQNCQIEKEINNHFEVSTIGRFLKNLQPRKFVIFKKLVAPKICVRLRISTHPRRLLLQLPIEDQPERYRRKDLARSRISSQHSINTKCVCLPHLHSWPISLHVGGSAQDCQYRDCWFDSRPKFFYFYLYFFTIFFRLLNKHSHFSLWPTGFFNL